MKFLFNSKGEHVANFIDDQLYTPNGNNMGHFLKVSGIFIDMNGSYLGEIIRENRILKNINSPYKSVNYGNYGNYGNIGNYGNPGNHGNIGVIGGYEDLSI